MEVYRLLENPVCPQKSLNLDRLRNKDHTKESAWIYENLGLNRLIERQCNYNFKLVQQFFASLIIGAGPNIPISWMANGRVCHSDFVLFAAVLGYPFTSVDEPSGTRMHSEYDVYSK